MSPHPRVVDSAQDLEAIADGGDAVVTVPTDFGVVGMAICYDLRFPELFRGLLDAGAELIVVPAAWPAARLTHWRLLTRTRALEEQVFLLACCATGTHGDMCQAGHSVVVDPWGTVLGEAGTTEEILTVDLDMTEVTRIRTELPVLRDRVDGPGNIRERSGRDRGLHAEHRATAESVA